MSIRKRTWIADRFDSGFTSEIESEFSSLQFNNPALNLPTPASFSGMTAQGHTPRQVQFGFRLEC